MIPDLRIEYDVDGVRHHRDVEVVTDHYDPRHVAAKARAGFAIYGPNGQPRP
jgi:hypothetical protein